MSVNEDPLKNFEDFKKNLQTLEKKLSQTGNFIVDHDMQHNAALFSNHLTVGKEFVGDVEVTLSWMLYAEVQWAVLVFYTCF
jgi:hypothetical protein